MTFHDWNPLKFFRELGTIARTIFLLAFIFLGVGIATGLSPHNRTVILALAMVAFSLMTHYFSRWSYPVRISDHASVKWGNLLRGIIMLAVTGALGWWLWVVSGRPTH